MGKRGVAATQTQMPGIRNRFEAASPAPPITTTTAATEDEADSEDEEEEEEAVVVVVAPVVPVSTSVAVEENKQRKILTRAVTAVGMMSSFLFIVFWLGHLAVCGLIVVLQTMIFKELVGLRYQRVKQLSAETEMEIKFFRTIQWSWFIVAMVYAYGSSFLKAPMGLSELLNIDKSALILSFVAVDEVGLFQAFSFLLYSLVFSATVLSFRKGLYKFQLIQLTWTLMTLTGVVAQLKFIVYMVHEGLFWFLFPVSLVVANDTFAYFCGMAFGRRVFGQAKFLQLSPNKTWEGFLGGLVLTVVYAVGSVKVWASSDFIRCGFHELQMGKSHCFSDALFTTRPGELLCPMQVHAVWFGLFASLVAPFGGFFASAVKRAFKVKDFDSFIPGHGGVTDRMDCQLIMSLFAYVYYSTFIATLHLKMPLNQVLSSFDMLDSAELQVVAEKILARIADPVARQALCGAGAGGAYSI